MMKETKMARTDLDDLDDLFAEARVAVSLDDQALMTRVYADALRLQPHAAALTKPVAAINPGRWATLVTTLGGKRGLAGLGTAAAAGVMLGFVQPTSVLALTESFFAVSSVEEVDLMPGIDAILTEG